MSNIIDQAHRCLKCRVPNCSKHCPVSTPIPAVMTLFEEGKIREAGEILFSNNPLSAICSIICPHENNCYGNCVLGKKGSPVSFFEVEQYVSGFYAQTYRAPEIERNGINVAVIGSGPAGLTVSILLSQRGYSVTLFEKRDHLGGVLRYGIPEFRLPKKLIDTYEEMLRSLGVIIRPNTNVGRSISLDDMFADGYKAVFLASGTNRPNKLGLLGETLGNVHYAIDYLQNPSAYRLGDNVAVIGAGNVAMDAARSAIRASHSHVTIIHHLEDEDMTGCREEIEMAKIDGVEFLHRASAVRITPSEVICAKTDIETNEDGKRIAVEDFSDMIHVKTDSVIIALGQGPNSGHIKSLADLDTTARGLIAIDESGQTSRKGVFAAGDVVSGPKTVVEAVAQAKKIADGMERYLLTL